MQLVFRARSGLVRGTPAGTPSGSGVFRCEGLRDDAAEVRWRPGEVTLSLDRSGLERLFYVCRGEEFVVTNDLWDAARGALQFGQPLSVDHCSVAYGRSPFAGVGWVEVGVHVTAVYDCGWRIRAYTIGLPATQEPPAEDIVAALRGNLDASLPSRGAVAVILSGGLDSSIVAALCCEVRHRTDVVLLHLRFPHEWRAFEAPLAREVATYLGTRLEEIVLRSEDYASDEALATGALFYALGGWHNVIQQRAASIGDTLGWGAGAEAFQGDGFVLSPVASPWRPASLASLAGMPWDRRLNAAKLLLKTSMFRRASYARFACRDTRFRCFSWPGSRYAFANTLAGPTVRTVSPFSDSHVFAAGFRLSGSLQLLDKNLLRDRFAKRLPLAVVQHGRVGTPAHPRGWIAQHSRRHQSKDELIRASISALTERLGENR